MKKLLALLLALAMMLGCMAFAEGVDYTGTWVLTGAVVYGITIGQVGLEMAGAYGHTMTLHADGTIVNSMSGMEDKTGTWVVAENGITVSIGSSDQTLSYQDEVLSLEQYDGTIMMYTREGAAPAVDDARPAVVVLANVDPADFEGKWLLTNLALYGREMSLEEMSMHMELEISDGKCSYDATTGDDRLTTEMSYTVEEVDGVGTVLHLNKVDETTGELSEFLALNMLEDGRLYILRGVAETYLTRQ